MSDHAGAFSGGIAGRARRGPDRAGRGGHGHDLLSATGHGQGGPASKFVTVAYGFWIFLLSDIIIFSAFFAAYAVLSKATAGGPTGKDLFELTRVAVQTGLLLTSSFTGGLATLAAHRRSMAATQSWLLVTGLLGVAFLFLEVQEFAAMVGEQAGPSRSAFLSAFFALVGCHGTHVGLGLLWLGTMMAQLWVKGFRADFLRRLHCFGLFWHALDIIWVAIFTLVYLLGASP
ncbi:MULTISPECIES: cytochrome (ubi)quinol oxidase subunit III [unclassified Mesorhizobium]|uniref:cytochrome (ubi)quinol oxidase subunit III n=1 Tax=unclassified Mesorhizobium TaxID=325217 RepID=UPI000BAE8C3E|nr:MULTISPECIES: cytochrome (ubi)quinol oxidase subunit III [unclassified Mesorhizobium]AZO08560.1 cytochrome (ubi)quinol oxidase subunit III [Mesorhizobium sp. M3A.F.Ca.ET.080.04.2.1]PBB85435.1 cytochrome o ubiquinol oxidase subunit III [Mesorhizobium sp. WSM3876]RWB71678.1 MAG: cytochrome (ubi)quinol oxidase subunit III [Mesorhizobium sp.]RWB85070.1 MAG: cytochrome (ubi)quinol oxidase subunit III [Mesorhizobium sp.]RWE34207.1 MAG: cytochrome (ubi)quinol oxidase subunit III [Mesorhizobium sp.